MRFCYTCHRVQKHTCNEDIFHSIARMMFSRSAACIMFCHAALGSVLPYCLTALRVRNQKANNQKANNRDKQSKAKMSDEKPDLHSLIRKHSGKLTKARQEQWVQELKAMGVKTKEKALKMVRKPHRGGHVLCQYSNLVADACAVLKNDYAFTLHGSADMIDTAKDACTKAVRSWLEEGPWQFESEESFRAELKRLDFSARQLEDAAKVYRTRVDWVPNKRAHRLREICRKEFRMKEITWPQKPFGVERGEAVNLAEILIGWSVFDKALLEHQHTHTGEPLDLCILNADESTKSKKQRVYFGPKKGAHTVTFMSVVSELPPGKWPIDSPMFTHADNRPKWWPKGVTRTGAKTGANAPKEQTAAGKLTAHGHAVQAFKHWAPLALGKRKDNKERFVRTCAGIIRGIYESMVPVGERRGMCFLVTLDRDTSHQGLCYYGKAMICDCLPNTETHNAVHRDDRVIFLICIMDTRLTQPVDAWPNKHLTHTWKKEFVPTSSMTATQYADKVVRLWRYSAMEYRVCRNGELKYNATRLFQACGLSDTKQKPRCVWDLSHQLQTEITRKVDAFVYAARNGLQGGWEEHANAGMPTHIVTPEGNTVLMLDKGYATDIGVMAGNGGSSSSTGARGRPLPMYLLGVMDPVKCREDAVRKLVTAMRTAIDSKGLGFLKGWNAAPDLFCGEDEDSADEGENSGNSSGGDGDSGGERPKKAPKKGKGRKGKARKPRKRQASASSGFDSDSIESDRTWREDMSSDESSSSSMEPDASEERESDAGGSGSEDHDSEGK